MILAKDYRTVTKVVKVMPRILWPLFFPRTRTLRLNSMWTNWLCCTLYMFIWLGF